MPLDQNENDATRDECCSHRNAGSGQLDTQFVQYQAANDRDEEGDQDFEIEFKSEWVSPVRHHFEPLLKKRENGQHGAALDHDIKKIAPAAIKPLLKNE